MDTYIYIYKYPPTLLASSGWEHSVPPYSKYLILFGPTPIRPLDRIPNNFTSLDLPPFYPLLPYSLRH